jgi:hypothetical protein
MLLLVLAALILPFGCAAPADSDEHDACELEVQKIGTTSEALSSYSCQMTTATGYKDGVPFTIKVVTVDDEKVEWKTANAYLEMAKAAQNAGVQLRVVSGFRTMAEQQYLYNCYINCNCNNCNLAAKPGASNHQSGHALDLNTSSPGVYTWLSNHGDQFGFERTVPSEAWHWEWWGQDDGDGPCNDDDKDNDGVKDDKDNCPNVKNAGQTDTDGDGKGDACDGDDDSDGIADETDNCPKKANAAQADADRDGKGDACEQDDDGDGSVDSEDPCPSVADSGSDLDEDGLGDACDDDDDGDDVPDLLDECPTTPGTLGVGEEGAGCDPAGSNPPPSGSASAVDQNSEPSSVSTEASGCSASARAPSGDGALWLALALAAMTLPRRRMRS